MIASSIGLRVFVVNINNIEEAVQKK